MKICACSDFHGELPEIPPCDILLIAGDICPHFSHPLGGHDDVFGQMKWLLGPFDEWLNKVPAKEVVACWGNHDYIGEKKPHMVPKLRWHLLNDAGEEVMGLKIWGTPWQPYFYGWAFNAPDGEDGEVFLDKKFSEIPDGTDIIVCHGPPAGYGDIARDGRPTGSVALLNAIKRVKPSLVVGGHIHGGTGKRTWDRGNMAPGIIANVCVLDDSYNLTKLPMIFDL